MTEPFFSLFQKQNILFLSNAGSMDFFVAISVDGIFSLSFGILMLSIMIIFIYIIIIITFGCAFPMHQVVI